MADVVQLPILEKSEKRFDNDRNDIWWITPVLQGTYFLIFALYAIWAAAIDFDYYKTTIGNTTFVSPFYNPDIEVGWWPEGLSPGLMLIWAPVGFRATCYYARKMYYRAFFWDPPGCAISEVKAYDGQYRGESKLPYILNNLHRYFFYLAFILAILHAAEFFNIIFEGGFSTVNGSIATLLLGVDAFFLALYVLSCHSCKHVIGGNQNRSNGSQFRRVRFNLWTRVKALNVNHHAYFWLSLTTILLADIYIRFGLARGLF